MFIKEKITGIILAGGKSSRMGGDKSRLIFRGKRLIEYPYDLMKNTCHQIVVSTNSSDLQLPDVTYIFDNYSNTGPLAGLEAALSQSDTSWNFVVPCDMPFVDKALFTALYQEKEGYDCVVPVDTDGKATPLIGFFKREILPIVRQQIQSGDHKMFNLLKKLHVKYHYTKNNKVLINFNSMNDLKPFLEKQKTTKPFWPNLILIAGAGRNTGKTSLACDIIKQLSKKQEIIAVKVSPHHHMIDAANPLLVDKQGLTIAEELNINNKDSSRMKQAGAAHSLYVQTMDEKIPELMQWLKTKWPKGLFICESGGMIHHLKPGLFFFLKTGSVPEEKKRLLDFNPLVVHYTNGQNDFDTQKVTIEDGAFKHLP